MCALVLASAGCVYYQDVGGDEIDAGATAPVPDALAADARDCSFGDCGPGHVAVSGRLFHIDSGLPFVDPGSTGDPCTGAVTGVCSLQVLAFDALRYAQDPSSAPIAELALNDRGEILDTGVPAPALGFLAVVVRARAGVTGWVESAVAIPVMGGSRATVRLPVVSDEVDAMWTASAGAPYGPETIGEHGAALLRFGDTAGPRAGVGALESGRAPRAAHYVAGTDPVFIDPVQTVTGPSGAVLLTEGELVAYSGVGGEPAGCEWDSVLSATIPGVILYTPVRAIDPGTGAPCP